MPSGLKPSIGYMVVKQTYAHIDCPKVHKFTCLKVHRVTCPKVHMSQGSQVQWWVQMYTPTVRIAEEEYQNTKGQFGFSQNETEPYNPNCGIEARYASLRLSAGIWL